MPEPRARWAGEFGRLFVARAEGGDVQHGLATACRVCLWNDQAGEAVRIPPHSLSSESETGRGETLKVPLIRPKLNYDLRIHGRGKTQAVRVLGCSTTGQRC